MQHLVTATTCLELLGATGITETDGGQFDFELGGCNGFALVRGDALIGAVWLGHCEDVSVHYPEALAWVGLQQAPAGCEIELLDWVSGMEIWLRFEQPLGRARQQTPGPLHHDVAALARAWHRREIEPVAALTQ